MDKQAQDKIWNDLSEDYKEDHRHFYKTYKDFAEETNFYTICRQMEKTFGIHNLNPKQTPKTWEDVVKLHEDYYYIGGNTSGVSDALKKKAVATLKIAKLIELGYGGMVSEEEWKDSNTLKHIVYCTTNNKLSIQSQYTPFKHFVAFHTKQQAEEFMSYESNRKLVEMYYCL